MRATYCQDSDGRPEEHEESDRREIEIEERPTEDPNDARIRQLEKELPLHLVRQETRRKSGKLMD